MSGQPSDRQPRYATLSPLAAKIGFNDPLVGLDHARGALSQLLAVIEDEHRLAQSHDDLHVVLDQEDGLPAVPERPDGVQQLVEQGAGEDRKSTRLKSSDRQ